MDNQETITLPNVPNNSGKGKGKLVAAIIGILILVAAVVAGIVLVQQRQLINQQAAAPTPGPGECGQVGVVCQAGTTCQNGICTPTAGAAICGDTCTKDTDCAKSSGLGFQPVCNSSHQCANPNCPNNTQAGTICACQTNFGTIACGDPCGAQANGSVLPIACANGGICGNSANGGTDGNNYCLPADGTNPNYVTKGGICAKDPNQAVFCINKTNGIHVTTQAEIKQACAVATAAPTGSPTIAPVVTSTPIATATAAPTTTPTATARVSIPATNAPVPVTGNETPTIIALVIAVILIIGSFALILL